MTIWNILQPFGIPNLQPFGIVCGHLVCFSVLVCLDLEKSGNPACVFSRKNKEVHALSQVLASRQGDQMRL
jgi:hypothetical protein